MSQCNCTTFSKNQCLRKHAHRGQYCWQHEDCKTSCQIKNNNHKKTKSVAERIPAAKKVLKSVIDAYNSQESNKKRYDISMFEKMKDLGEGSYGHVYSALNKKTNKTIVIKQIDKISTSEKDIKKEVRVLKYLKPHCKEYVLCFDKFFEDENNWYIITEYLGDYVPLNDFKKYSTLQTDAEQEHFFGIIKNMYLGLKTLHSYGVAHRDIKPENILVNVNVKDAKIKYIDFGFSCISFQCNYAEITQATLLYIGPEVFHKKRVKPYNLIDVQKLDIWALGVTIYYMIAEFVPLEIWEMEVNLREGKKYADTPEDFLTEIKDFLHSFVYLSPKSYTYEEDEFVEKVLETYTDNPKISLKHMLIKDPEERKL